MVERNTARTPFEVACIEMLQAANLNIEREHEKTAVIKELKKKLVAA